MTTGRAVRQLESHPAGVTRLVVTRAPRRAEAIVLVLHGGAGPGTVPVSLTQPSVLRMIPIAGRIAYAGRGRLVVLRVVNAVRGIATETRSPLADVEWALQEARSRFGPQLPVCLVGHSLGGWVALNAAGDPSVHSVVALAPWLSGRESVTPLLGRQTLIVHGGDDRVTSPVRSAAFARSARQAGAAAGYVEVTGGEHTMLRRLRVFDSLAADFAVASLLPEGRGKTRSAVVRRALAGESPQTV